MSAGIYEIVWSSGAFAFVLVLDRFESFGRWEPWKLLVLSEIGDAHIQPDLSIIERALRPRYQNLATFPPPPPSPVEPWFSVHFLFHWQNNAQSLNPLVCSFFPFRPISQIPPENGREYDLLDGCQFLAKLCHFKPDLRLRTEDRMNLGESMSPARNT